jgi:hypothetical protein
MLNRIKNCIERVVHPMSVGLSELSKQYGRQLCRIAVD